MRTQLLALLVACNGAGDDPTSDRAPGTDTDTDTDTDPAPGTGDTATGPSEVLSASCTLDPLHTQLVRCTATMSRAGPALLVLTTGSQPDRSYASATDATTHELLGWGLKADTDYTWSIGPHTGTVRTAPLPAALQGASVSVTGTPFGFDAVLQPLECASQVFMVMIDGEGDIVWYLPNNQFKSQLDGYEWSQVDRSVLSVGRNTFQEQHVGGTELLRLERNVDFSGFLHHDAGRWGSYTYLLYEEQVGSLDVDGIHVFEGTTRIGSFFLDDHYDTSVGGGFFGDWSHANGVNPTGDGEVVLSLLNFDTVLGIDGDPGSPTFLDIAWSVAGSLAGLPGPTYQAVDGSGEGFDGQHDATRFDPDHLLLFDNGGVGVSRAARYVLDEPAGELRLDAEWRLSRFCPVQGGAVPLDGGVLVSCPDNREVAAYLEGSTTPEWVMAAECDSGFFAVGINRGIPVTIE